MCLLGKLCWTSGLLYFIAQFLGAMLGAAILWGCTVSEEVQGGMCTTVVRTACMCSLDIDEG